MELLTNRVNRVYFDGESGWSVSASWTQDGVAKGALAVAETETGSGLFSAAIPYMSTESTVSVTWNFSVPASGAHTRVDNYQVVTPYLTLREVKEIVDDISDEEAIKLEAGVRLIINAHCGQSFGRSVKSLTVYGNSRNHLALPERLIAPSTINGRVPGGVYVKHGYFLYGSLGGFAIGSHGWNEEKLDFPITHPYARHLTGERRYEITGVWGFESVPEAIREAARLLVNDYACGDASYRDRYLSSITASDWQLSFSSGAYAQTGNVRADQLLSSYVRPRWAVV
jgi:hypothetical protein